MAIKVFTEVPLISGYVSGEFQVNVPFVVYQSEGGEENNPRLFHSNAMLSLAIGSTPIDVFAAVFTQILTDCAANGYPTPTKSDVYGYVPHNFTTLLPDLPQMA